MAKAIALDQLRTIEQKATLWEQHKQDLEISLRTRTSLLHPIRRLPAEVLETIFGMTIERAEMPPKDISREQFVAHCVFKPPKNDLWALGSTCRSWRHKLLSQPRLWSYICIDVSATNMESPAYFRRLTEHLQRSSLSPLHVAIGASDESLGDLDPLPDKVIYLLLGSSRRIVLLDVFLSLYALDSMKPLGGVVPALTHFRYISTSIIGPETNDLIVHWTSTAPSLRTARDVNVSFPHWDVRYSEALEELIIQDGSLSGHASVHNVGICAEEIGQLVLDYPRLKHLEVDATSLTAPAISPLPVAYSLRDLRITTGPVWRHDHALFTAPALNRLRLTLVGVFERGLLLTHSDDGDALSYILDFISRSEAPLRALHVENVGKNPESLAGIFSFTSHLTELRLIAYPDMKHVFKLLAKPRYGLPELRILELQGVFTLGNVQSLAERIAYMWETVKLDSVDLIWECVEEEGEEEEGKEETRKKREKMKLGLPSAASSIMHLPLKHLKLVVI